MLLPPRHRRLFLSLSWLGVFREAARHGAAGRCRLFAVAALAALYPLRFFRKSVDSRNRPPHRAANQLLHSPVLVQTDRPTGRDSFFQALWQEHQKRMAEKLGSLGATCRAPGARARPVGAARRGGACVGRRFRLFVWAARRQHRRRFSAHAARDAVPPRIDAWVTPPAYTGKARFLTADANQAAPVFTVPEGSDVSLRVTGGSGEETLSFADATAMPAPSPPSSRDDAAKPAPTGASRRPPVHRQADGRRHADAELGRDELASWAFAVIPDKPPEIRFAGEPKRAVNGTFELNYQIDDDYGAASAKADFALADPQRPVRIRSTRRPKCR